MKIKETCKCTIPEWALCYLINADTDYLTDEDLKTVTEWEKSWDAPIEVCMPEDAEPFFCGHPEFGDPAECYECEVITYTEE